MARSREIWVRLSEEEYQTIKRLANIQHQPVSAFVRGIITKMKRQVAFVDMARQGMGIQSKIDIWTCNVCGQVLMNDEVHWHSPIR